LATVSCSLVVAVENGLISVGNRYRRGKDRAKRRGRGVRGEARLKKRTAPQARVRQLHIVSNEQPTSVIAEGGFQQLREIQAALASAGIAAEIARPPQEHCSS